MGRYRVAHVGTGYTGSIALRHILQSDRLELVGQLVHSSEKAGRDCGELVGEPATGVRATNSIDDFLALDADCVLYFAAVSGRAMDDIVGQLCGFLASGKNVVTPSYPPLFHPPSLDDVARKQIEAACLRGNSTLFATGIAPGFTSDILAVHAASMCGCPTKISVHERIPCGAYRVPGFFAALGFGRTPEQDAAIYPPDAMIKDLAPPLRLIAQGLGMTVDEIREHRDVAVADHHYTFAAGDIPPGTIASVRMRFEAMIGGQPKIQFSIIWSMPDEPVDDWEPVIAAGSPTRRLSRITVDGDPPVQLDFMLNGGELPGSAATAARAVNAIPVVCAARPGVLSALDVVVPAHA